MRLDQFVSQATAMSRSEVQKAIRHGWVSVNQQIVKQTALQISHDAQVMLDQEVITLPGLIYIMLHKPLGVVSATEDASQRTVLDLIDHPHRHTLHIVGRLDKDTTGLILLTNDGAWSHRLTAPKQHVPKTYLATLAEPLSESAAQQLREGVQLKGEKHITQPAQVETLPNKQIRLTIHEGKYHQVKRMLAAVGNKVESLHREKIGNLVLDSQLLPSQWRVLLPDKTLSLVMPLPQK